MALKLTDLSNQELKEFFDSFDTVLCDVDDQGLVNFTERIISIKTEEWVNALPRFRHFYGLSLIGVLFSDILHIIDGAKESIKLLRNLKKKLYFISNNSTAPLDLYLSRFKELEAVKEEIVRPIDSIIFYLKKINFDKELYVIGFESFRNALRQAGFNVVYDEVVPVKESLEAAISIIKNLNPKVGAVIIDFSLNITYLQLQRCVEYIKRNNAIFLGGSWDTRLPLGKHFLIGSKMFAEIIEQATGISAIVLSKPGKAFQDVTMENIGPFDEKQVLFIGDSVQTDMTFATNCGFQKLLVLTGLTLEEDLTNWKHEESVKPDYVADSIKDLFTAASMAGIV